MKKPENAPSMAELAEKVGSPYWGSLCTYLEQTYSVSPSIEYSCCSMQPGWNIKYKKSSKSLCTLYPEEGGFICLVVVGSKEEAGAELLMPALDPKIAEQYRASKPSSMGRWLMIGVDSEKLLEDVKTLIGLRMKKAS